MKKVEKVAKATHVKPVLNGEFTVFGTGQIIDGHLSLSIARIYHNGGTQITGLPIPEGWGV